MADTLSFQDAEAIIRRDPRRAETLAFEWQEFLKSNAKTSPEILDVETSEEFYRWAQEHPGINTSAWEMGKQISDAYCYLREEHENLQMREAGEIDRSTLPRDLAEMPLLASVFLQRAKIMEHDRGYQKIEEGLRREWLRKNKGKDFSSKEGLDYIYGSLDDKTQAAIHQEAQEAFRKDPKNVRKIERYDKEAKKIYKNHQDDPQWLTHEYNIQLETSARLEWLEKNRNKKIKVPKEEIKKSQEKIVKRIREKHQEEFMRSHPEKAKIYFARIEAKKIEARNKTITAGFPTPQTSSPHSTSIPTPTPTASRQISPRNRTSGGGLNRGINSLNRLMGGGLRNPLGKFGSRIAAQTALKGITAFLAANPWVWIALGVITLGIIVFTIVFSGTFGGIPGAPTSESSNLLFNPSPTQETSPTIIPAETITPAPAAL